MAYARIYSDSHYNMCIFDGKVPEGMILDIRLTDAAMADALDKRIETAIDEDEGVMEDDDAMYRLRAKIGENALADASWYEDNYVWEDVSDRCRLIADNAGGYTLQLGGWSHYYQDEADLAVDIREWHNTGSTSDWDGDQYDARLCDPSARDEETGGYRVIEIGETIEDTINNLRGCSWDLTEIANALEAL